MLAKVLFGFIFIFSFPTSADDKVYGKGYELGSDRKKLLFIYEWSTKNTPGKRSEVASYKSKDSKELLVTEETLFLVDSNKRETLRSYRIEQHQLGTIGEVENGPGERIFTYTAKGKVKMSKENLTENFVVSASLIAYLQEHWKEIKDGKTLKVDYGVMDRRTSYDFDLFKESTKPDGKIIVKMVASSIFVRAAVDPLYFEFSADGQVLHSMKGRTEAKLRDGSGFADIEAEVVYSAGP